MGSLSRRKRRTTAPPTRAGRTAGERGLALLAVLVLAGGASAQRPGVPAAVPPPLPLPGPAAQKLPAPKADPPPKAPNKGAADDGRLAASKIPLPEVIFSMFDDARLEREVLDATRKALEDAAKKEKRPPPALDPVPFPPKVNPNPSGAPYVAKTGGYPPAAAVVEPHFVVHRRLHFEELNSERYGWDLGFIGPVVSAANFYKDVLLWPNSLGTAVEVGTWDTSAGKCLPGTPVPYYLYPPHLTITGITTEVGVLTAGALVVNPPGAGNALLRRPLLR